MLVYRTFAPSMRCLGIIPAYFSSDERVSNEEILEFFNDDLCFPSAAKAELELWSSHFAGKELPDTPQTTEANPLLLPNVGIMLEYMTVLPLSSYEAER